MFFLYNRPWLKRHIIKQMISVTTDDEQKHNKMMKMKKSNILDRKNDI